MPYNNYLDAYHTNMTAYQLTQAARLTTAQAAINKYFVTDLSIGNMTVTDLIIALHLLPEVYAYAAPSKTGLQFRKYMIQQAINKEIQSYITRNY